MYIDGLKVLVLVSFSVSSFNANLSNVMYVHIRCIDQLPPFWEIAAPSVYNIAFVSCLFVLVYFTFEPPHEKTNNLHTQKQRRRSAVQ